MLLVMRQCNQHMARRETHYPHRLSLKVDHKTREAIRRLAREAEVAESVVLRRALVVGLGAMDTEQLRTI